uniref:DUF308 domain-containing protein n=1 Tax=uncultured bacterium fosmid pJB84G2 TaxID=1478072 RepID=A0A0H3U9Y7_9BACT|nr:hypothetical protein [uncultured bacterium fosmid pJB84G2]
MKIINRDFTSEFQTALKRHSVLAIILSVLCFALGVIFILSPLVSTAVFIWIGFGLMALCGLGLIIQFIFPRGEIRNGASLAFGILLIVLFVGLLLAAIFYPSKDPEVSGFALFTTHVIRFFSIFFGVCAIVNSAFAFADTHNEHYGLVVVSGIIGFILGVLMIIFPFVMTQVSGIIAGVYVIIIGIVMLVAAIKCLKHKN